MSASWLGLISKNCGQPDIYLQSNAEVPGAGSGYDTKKKREEEEGKDYVYNEVSNNNDHENY